MWKCQLKLCTFPTSSLWKTLALFVWLEMSEAFGSGTWLACFLLPKAASWSFLMSTGSVHCITSKQLSHLQQILSSKLSFLGNFEIWHSHFSFAMEDKKKGVENMILFHYLYLLRDRWSLLLCNLHRACQNHFCYLLQPLFPGSEHTLPPTWSVIFLYHIVALSATSCRLIRSQLFYVVLCIFFFYMLRIFFSIIIFNINGTHEGIAAKTASHNNKACVLWP